MKAKARRQISLHENLRQKSELAKKHRRKQLLIRFGFVPWTNLMDMVYISTTKAIDYYNDRLLQNSWSALFSYVKAIKINRYKREYRLTAYAVSHYKGNLVRYNFLGWKAHFKLMKAKARAITGHFSQ